MDVSFARAAWFSSVSSAPGAIQAAAASSLQEASLSEQTIRWITNRAPEPGQIADFGGDLSSAPRAGTALVDMPLATAMTEGEFKRREPTKYLREVRTAEEADAIGQFRAWIDDATDDGGYAWVFVHGFGTRFGEALCYAAQLQLALGDDLRALQRPATRVSVLLCSWPADGGGAFTYFEDRQNAPRSAPLLRDVIAATGGAAGRARTVLHCQSMGVRVLQGAWHLMGATVAAPALGNLVLTGADVADDALTDPQALAGIDALAHRTTVYFNPADQLGILSTIVNGSRPMSRGVATLPPAGRVDAVNVKNIWQRDVEDEEGEPSDQYGHYYARTNPIVRRDLLLTMLGEPSSPRLRRKPKGPGRYALV